MGIEPGVLQLLIPFLNLLMVSAIGAGGWILRRLVLRFDQLEEKISRNREELSGAVVQVERGCMVCKVDLPHIYVFREDYLRTTTVLERKIDAVGLDLREILGRFGESHD